MAFCNICNCGFRDNCNLNRHLSTPKHKNNTKINQNTPNITQNDHLDATEMKLDATEMKLDATEMKLDATEMKKSGIKTQNDHLDTLNTCKFCLNNFFKKNIKKHLLSCKQRDDPIRLLEIDQDICPVLPDSKTECRFCNKNLCNTSYLNKHVLICKEREDYHQTLLAKKKVQKVTSITNNNTNIGVQNNNTNVIINLGGSENLDHIQIEKIIDMWRIINKKYEPTQTYLRAGKLITSFDDYIRENIKNRNIIIPNSKCLYCEKKTLTGWEKVEIDECLNSAFKNSAEELYTRKDEIEECNDKVFQFQSNIDVFSEVKQFAKRGFNHCKYPDDLRKIKSGYKIGKLRDRYNDDSF